ncbi:hypothetical protein KKE06_01230 [Candidatus Micrarchaeota archaeon]|nr:hypothetical protein [Candidatus Micrarchaeota archaeon]MBU1930059.1 hypothetical protein [Candidatus Micrarchaeota archaeon]
MVLDILGNFLFSLASLVWTSFWYCIPIFLIVFLVGRRLHGFWREKAGRSWLQSAFLSSYLIVFVLLIIAFFFPVWQAFQDSSIGVPPPELRVTPVEMGAQFVLGLFRMAVVGILFAVLLLPLILLGEFVKDWLKTRIPNIWPRFFIAVWVVTFILVYLLLFWLSWVIPGLIYLIYWA